jgi:hypothetical protein
VRASSSARQNAPDAVPEADPRDLVIDFEMRAIDLERLLSVSERVLKEKFVPRQSASADWRLPGGID